MTKDFYTDCGWQMFSSGSAKPERRGTQVSVIDATGWLQSVANVNSSSRKLSSIPLDPQGQAVRQNAGLKRGIRSRRSS